MLEYLNILDENLGDQLQNDDVNGNNALIFTLDSGNICLRAI